MKVVAAVALLVVVVGLLAVGVAEDNRNSNGGAGTGSAQLSEEPVSVDARDFAQVASDMPEGWSFAGTTDNPRGTDADVRATYINMQDSADLTVLAWEYNTTDEARSVYDRRVRDIEGRMSTTERRIGHEAVSYVSAYTGVVVFRQANAIVEVRYGQERGASERDAVGMAERMQESLG